MEKGAEYLHYLQTLKISAFVSVLPQLLWLSKYTQVHVQTVAYPFLVPYLQLYTILLLIFTTPHFYCFENFTFFNLSAPSLTSTTYVVLFIVALIAFFFPSCTVGHMSVHYLTCILL